ncbi:MAG: hypothetical protein R3E64_08540 [Halioglobus sp.]
MEEVDDVVPVGEIQHSVTPRDTSGSSIEKLGLSLALALRRSYSILQQSIPNRTPPKLRLGVASTLFNEVLTKSCFFVGIILPPFWNITVLAEAKDPHQVVISALKKLDATDLDVDWYYAMEVAENDELRVVHSDPRRSNYEKRQLITLDGVPPDQRQLDNFHDAEVERIDGEDPYHRGYGNLADRQTLESTESAVGYSKLFFQPRVEAFEDSADKLRGTILFNTTTQEIEEIEILNTQPLSPAFSVTVESYCLTLRFQSEQGENLLKSLESHAAGTVGFLKRFDSLVEVTFSAYRRAEP